MSCTHDTIFPTNHIRRIQGYGTLTMCTTVRDVFSEKHEDPPLFQTPPQYQQNQFFRSGIAQNKQDTLVYTISPQLSNLSRKPIPYPETEKSQCDCGAIDESTDQICHKIHLGQNFDLSCGNGGCTYRNGEDTKQYGDIYRGQYGV